MAKSKTQIENLIANIINRHEDKRKQLETIQSICIHLTSDDGITIEAELYDNNICRFLIKGTRCSMTITYDTLTWELCRKPKNTKPWHSTWIATNTYKIFDRAEELNN